MSFKTYGSFKYNKVIIKLFQKLFIKRLLDVIYTKDWLILIFEYMDQVKLKSKNIM